MRCLRTRGTAFCDYHSHASYEFTLVTDDSTTTGCAAGKVASAPNTLFLFQPGETHGHWNSATQTPRFWVVHFEAPICRSLAHLASPDPRQRIWQLAPEHTASFKWMFMKLFNEQTQTPDHHRVAVDAWLHLLLVSVERWVAEEQCQRVLPEQPDSDVMQLWYAVIEGVDRSAEFYRQLSRRPNYDSVRHRFKNVFGASPSQLLARLRMQKASKLLLETRLSIKEIASSLGYERQHEFTRAFRKHSGESPSGWRARPFSQDVSTVAQ